LNISPETKIGKILEKTEDEYKLSLINGKIISLSKEKFLKLVEREKICISDYDVLYTQKTKGVVPCYIDKLYKQRVDAKNEMQKYQKEISNVTDKVEKQKIKQKIQDLDTQQNVYKLVLNSIYGTFAQKFSPLYDIDHSASVTMTGQSVIKKASDIVFDYMKERGFSGEKSGVYLYSDTDSIFFTIEPILNNEKETLLNDKKEVTQTAKKIIDEIDQKLNKEIIDWSKQKHNSIDPRFVFKRETICDKGLFLEKKMYILHVIDKEGTKPKKPFVYKGVELAKSTMSSEVKDLIRNVVESIILSEDKKESDNIFIESYKKFLDMDTNLISTRKKITDITKYESKTVGFKTPKGTPNHVKASIFFNNLLKSYNIEHLYEKISSGNKVKIFYVSKNKYNISVISYNEVFPEEIKKDIVPDYEKMFKKTVSPPLERIYSCIGWNFPSLTCNYETDITSLFSEDSDE
jgi:DNA polymerase elongation subunit (family B)